MTGSWKSIEMKVTAQITQGLLMKDKKNNEKRLKKAKEAP